MDAGGTGETEIQFALRNWSAFLDGELEPADARRVEVVVAGYPDLAAFLAAHRQLEASLGDSLARTAPPCPEGLRGKVLAALDRCEEPGHIEPLVRFPWLSMGALAAASVMMAISLFLVFGPREEQPDPAEHLRTRLSPMVANISLEAPKSDRCRYRDAKAEYEQWFQDGPALPSNFDGTRCRVSDFGCPEVNGRRVMCTVYDDPSGERFALIVFRCRRTADLLPEFLDAAELEIEGRRVMLWREGNYVRALVGSCPPQFLRQRAVLLRPPA